MEKEAKQNSGIVGNCYFWARDISRDSWNTRDRFQRQKLSVMDLQDDRSWANWSVPSFRRTSINSSALLCLQDGSCVGIIPQTNINCQLNYQSLSLPNILTQTPSIVCLSNSFSTTGLYQPSKPSCTQHPNPPFHTII